MSEWRLKTHSSAEETAKKFKGRGNIKSSTLFFTIIFIVLRNNFICLRGKIS